MDAAADGRPDWATVPNIITGARLVLFVPVVVGLIASRQFPIATTIVLVLFGATDWIDGYLARRLNQVTRLGAIIDPLADRAGEMSIYAVLLAVGLLPWWAPVVIVGVDLAMFAIVALRLRTLHQVAVTWVGKIRTTALMASLPLLTLSQSPLVPGPTLYSAGLVLLVVGCALHIVAGTQYALAMLKR